MKRAASLQARLLATLLGVVLLPWAGISALTWLDTRHEIDELLDAHLAQAAALLVVQQAGEMPEDRDVDTPRLHRYAPKVAFQVFHEGRLGLHSDNAPPIPMMGDGAHAADGYRTVQIDGVRWRVFATHGAKADVQVYVGERMDSRADILGAMLRGALVPMLLAPPLLALAAWWAVSRGLAPLRQLGRELAQRRPDALHPVALAQAPREMQPMIDALNRLFERMARLLDAERRFTADAAHELRTPIAAIRAQAQVALGEHDDELRRHALHATLQGCDRAARLVDQLLTLSRLDADAAVPLQPVDLGAVTRQVVAEIAARALGKAQSLALEAEPRCLVRADEALLAVLVRNLVDNAVRYSPDGARIAVRVGRAAGDALLQVDDSGPGLPPQQLQRLGERFFRVPGSDESGSGLGWSIVRRVADALHARVSASASPMGGLAVRVAFAAQALPGDAPRGG